MSPRPHVETLTVYFYSQFVVLFFGFINFLFSLRQLYFFFLFPI